MPCDQDLYTGCPESSTPHSISAGKSVHQGGYLSQARRYERLGLIFLEFYYCEGPSFLLDAVVELLQAFTNLTVICDSLQAPAAMAHMGDAYFAVFELNYDLKALTRSIRFYQRVLTNDSTLTPSQRLYVETRLAYALIWRFRSSVRLEDDCQNAFQILDKSKDSSVYGLSQAWSTIVTSLAKGDRATWSTVPVTAQDLMNVLDDLRSVRNLPLPRSLYILSVVAESRLANSLFVKNEQPEHLHPTMERMHSTVQHVPKSADVLHYQSLTLLSGLHYNAHFHTKDKVECEAHLETSVKLAAEARSLENLMTRNVRNRWYSLYEWAKFSMDYAMFKKDLDAMEKAANAFKEAVVTYPDSISRDNFPFIVNDFVVSMGLYFDQSGRIGILDELLLLVNTAVSQNIIQRTPYLAGNIAEAMLYRARIADVHTARSLVDDAIRICQARKASPDYANIENVERIAVEVQLISAAQMQIRAGNRPCIDPASMLQLAQQTSALVLPQDISLRATLVVAQTDALIRQARVESNISLLKTGLKRIEEEIASPEVISSVYWADLLAAHADLLFAQAQLEGTGSRKLLDSVWDQYKRVADTPSGRPRERFQACLRWADRATESRHTTVACNAFSHAIDILPHVVFLGEDVIGRIEALRQVSGLASSSVSVALAVGDIPMALDFLERTRGIIWLQSMGVRDAELSSIPPALRERFLNVIRELENPDLLHWKIRRKRAEELGNVIEELRAFPGLERFRLPPLIPDVQLALQKKGGYTVIIVPTTTHCDVMILGLGTTHFNARHLRISTLTVERIRYLLRTFNRSTSDARAVSRKILKAVDAHSIHRDPIIPLLSELWSSLVHPILKYMGIHRMQDHSSRKRLWWCPIGALSSLPLHAAGLHEESPDDHIGNYVLSSYIPTISTLYRLLTETSIHTHKATSPKMLLVAQQNADGLASLINAQVEIDEIKALVSPHHTLAENDDGGMLVGDAMNGLKHAHVIHLACHGHQDQDNPLNSGFELKDGRLTLGQLMQLNIPHARLAYLSACDSAGMDESRPDEGLNLVGTMIFVGFRSVVGTMWAMDDVDGPFMAKRIYARIFKNGILDLDEVPFAVDDAVRQLRESGVAASRWATYVHFGV